MGWTGRRIDRERTDRTEHYSDWKPPTPAPRLLSKYKYSLCNSLPGSVLSLWRCLGPSLGSDSQPHLSYERSLHTLYGILVITRDNTRRQTQAEADLTGIHREGGDRLGTVSRGILALCLLCSVSACGGLGLSPGQRGPECSEWWQP